MAKDGPARHDVLPTGAIGILIMGMANHFLLDLKHSPQEGMHAYKPCQKSMAEEVISPR